MHEIQKASAPAHAGRGSHGNGLRIHVLLFGLLSFAVLVGFVALIAASSTRM